jgi:hypothetical protein
VKGLKGKDFLAEIINAEGRKVLEVKISEDQSIDISSLQTGVYFITIKADELKVYSQKIIVK